MRRLLLALLIVLSALYAWNSLWQQPAILPNFVCYFFSGMLLADLYSSRHKLKLDNSIGFATGAIILLASPFVISLHTVWLFLLKLLLLFAAFYFVLFNDRLRKLMSRRWITIIGGMCYSIYLLHVLIISGVSQGLLSLLIIDGPLGIFFYGLILILAVLIFSAVFYRLIEQPCMRKGWWRAIFRRKEIWT